jgi:hypothetical protein
VTERVPPQLVFISYSREPAELLPWVRKLERGLRDNGVNVILDEQHLRLGADSTTFMRESVQRADRVLLICTDAYVDKVENPRGGSGYEMVLIKGELIKDLSTTKFVPVIPPGQSGRVPSELATRRHSDFRKSAERAARFEELVRELGGVSPLPGRNPFASEDASDLPAAAPAEGESAEATWAHEEPPQDTYLAMSVCNIPPAADGTVTAVALVTTDEPRELTKSVDDWRAWLSRDPRILAESRKQLGSASLEYLVNHDAARAYMLEQMSVTPFSGYVYYAPSAALAALDDAEGRQRLFVNSLFRRFSKKSERIVRAQSDIAGFNSFVASAVVRVEEEYGRQVTPPQTAGRDLGRIVELARLVAWATACHLERLTDESARATFESLRTRIRFAGNAVTGEWHTRDENPLP